MEVHMVSQLKTAATIRAIPASFKAAPEGTLKDELHGNTMLQLKIQLPMAGTWKDYEDKLTEIKSGKRLAEGKPQFLTRQERRAIFGAKREHVGQLKRIAKKHGLSFGKRSEADLDHGLVPIKGRYTRFKTFLPGLHFAKYEDEHGDTHIGRQGTYNVDGAAPPIDGIFDGDNRKTARAYFRIADEGKNIAGGKKPKSMGTPSTWTAREQAKAWGFPVDDYTNDGQFAAGYVSLDGNNGDLLLKDAQTLAKERNLPFPKSVLELIGGSKDGDYKNGATVENILDLLQHFLLNPSGAVVAFKADNDDGAFCEAAETAGIYAGVKVGNKIYKLLALTISWGSPESGNTLQSLQRWARAVASARLGGLIITSATGDDGSRDKTEQPTPDAPSSVTGMFGAAGVGFTTNSGAASNGKKRLRMHLHPEAVKQLSKQQAADLQATLDTVYIWDQTGGGVSGVFDPMPEEVAHGFVQKSIATGRPGKNASTLAYVAAPESGPMVLNNKKRFKVGGTSNSAPGLGQMLARLQYEVFKKFGFYLPDVMSFLFDNRDKGIFFVLSAEGSNGDYSQKPEDKYGVPVGFGPICYPVMLKVAFEAAAEHAKQIAAHKAAA
jgi:hypothetical protein